MTARHVRRLVVVTTLALLWTGAGQAQAPLSKEQMRQFLLTAKIVKSQPIGRGITLPDRLTLSDGTLTYDAAFQAVEERKPITRFARGGTEINFADSYHFNIAAYGLAELLGLDDMMPVTVERQWQGKVGALSWWINRMFDEGERLKQNIHPPDLEAWNRQMFKLRVFAQLVYDTDRNLGNVLITEDWKIWMIDFTRAFRRWDDIKNPKDLERCDRQLFDRLRQLTLEAVQEKTKPHLSRWEIEPLMARRDKIVAHFEKLIAEKGEAAVLY